jgi:hypothetical protein
VFIRNATLSDRIFERRGDFGLRRQPAEAKRSEDWSAAATALSNGVARSIVQPNSNSQSGVALRLPPQSKKFGCDYAAL